MVFDSISWSLMLKALNVVQKYHDDIFSWKLKYNALFNRTKDNKLLWLKYGIIYRGLGFYLEKTAANSIVVHKRRKKHDLEQKVVLLIMILTIHHLWNSVNKV